jgi:hypothetical protein
MGREVRMVSADWQHPKDAEDHYTPLFGGSFGRDSYEDKRVEAIGSDWVVVRYDNGYMDCYSGDPEDLCEYRTEPEPESDDEYYGRVR